MFRRFVIYLNLVSFVFMQNAFAAPNSRLAPSIEFLKDSEITKHEVALKEFHSKFGAQMPAEIRMQMEAFLKENPDVKIPKMDVKKVDFNGQERLQINMTTPEGSLVFTTPVSATIAYSVVGKVNGHEVKTEIPYSAILNAHQTIYEERIELAGFKEPVLMSHEMFNKLNSDEKRAYIRQMREVMEATEAVQKTARKPAKDFSQIQFILESLTGTEAQALMGNSCVVAGWTNGTWDGQHCNSPSESKACGSNKRLCNPVFYGEGNCIDFSSASDKQNATANCGKSDKDLTKVVDYYKKTMSDKDINKVFESVKQAARDQKDECDKWKANNSKQRDQVNTCSELKSRIASLNTLSCAKYESGVDGPFKDQCKKETTAPVASAAPALPIPAPTAVATPAPLVRGEVKKCSEVTKDNGKTDDHQHCEEPKFVDCLDTDGKTLRSLSYCGKCSDGFQLSKLATAVGSCEKVDPSKPGRDKAGMTHGDYERPPKSWWQENKDWVIPTGMFAGIAGLIYLQYRSQQDQINQYYSYLNPAGVSAPPVIYSNTPNVNPPPPSSKTFQLPGVR